MKIDSLEVRWPTGKTESFKDVAADKIYAITEGRDKETAALACPGVDFFLAWIPSPCFSAAALFARSLHVTSTKPCSLRNCRNSALFTVSKSR